MNKKLSSTTFAALGILALSLSACSTPAPGEAGSQGSAPAAFASGTPSDAPSDSSAGSTSSQPSSTGGDSTGASSAPGSSSAAPSSSSEAPRTGGGQLYDFPPEGTPPLKGKEFTIALPKDLKAAAIKGDTSLIIEGYRVESSSLDTDQWCARDIDIKYAPGGKKKLLEYSKKHVKKTPGMNDGIRIGKLMFGGKLKVIDMKTINTAEPIPGNYISEDGESISSVEKCVNSKNTGDSGTTLNIVAFNEGVDSSSDQYVEKLASVRIVSLTLEKIFTAGGSVNGWERDGSGAWVKKQ